MTYRIVETVWEIDAVHPDGHWRFLGRQPQHFMFQRIAEEVAGYLTRKNPGHRYTVEAVP